MWLHVLQAILIVWISNGRPFCTRISAEPPTVKLYVYAEGNLRNESFLPVLMNWTQQAKECGYDGMFYADSDLQTLHLGPPANDSGCEWCGLGSAAGFLSSAAQWVTLAQSLDFGLYPLVFPFGPSDPILLQPEPTESHHRSSIHNLVEPIPFAGTEFRVEQDGGDLALVDSMEHALQNPGFNPPPSGGQEFAHWLQDKPGERTFVDRVVKHGASGASLRIGPGAGDGMAMQRLVVPQSRLAKVSFWARTENFSAIQYNVEVRTLAPSRADACAQALGRMAGSNRSAAVGADRCAVWMTKGRRLSWWPLALNKTQGWQHFEYTAPTWSEPVGLFIGIEDRGTPQAGTIWLCVSSRPLLWSLQIHFRSIDCCIFGLWLSSRTSDDVEIQETALLNIVRRDGTSKHPPNQGHISPLTLGDRCTCQAA